MSLQVAAGRRRKIGGKPDQRQRKPFKWPGNNSLAVWFAPNVEVWQYDSAFGVGISPNPTNYVPDVFNYAWREYGPRVGLWRLADVLDEAGNSQDRDTCRT